MSDETIAYFRRSIPSTGHLIQFAGQYGGGGGHDRGGDGQYGDGDGHGESTATTPAGISSSSLLSIKNTLQYFLHIGY